MSSTEYHDATIPIGGYVMYQRCWVSSSAVTVSSPRFDRPSPPPGRDTCSLGRQVESVTLYSKMFGVLAISALVLAYSALTVLTAKKPHILGPVLFELTFCSVCAKRISQHTLPSAYISAPKTSEIRHTHYYY